MLDVIVETKFVRVLIVLVMILWAGKLLAQSRSRIDLDDMMIKGELHNDDRINIYTRQKNELKNYVKFRTSYKQEMLEELPVVKVKHKF